MRKWFLLPILFLLAACSREGAELPLVEPTPRPNGVETAVSTPHPSRINPRGDVPETVSFGITLSKDAIYPIYQPKFVLAEDAPYQDDELVMGVTLNGEAKAYNVSVLRFREMVNDELGGTPILVSW